MALALLGALVMAAASGVSANGAPVKISLLRLPQFVNFGANTARGLAEITAVEGDVTLTVTGLDRLTAELYQG
jgi:hypothetical protein